MSFRGPFPCLLLKSPGPYVAPPNQPQPQGSWGTAECGEPGHQNGQAVTPAARGVETSVPTCSPLSRPWGSLC